MDRARSTRPLWRSVRQFEGRHPLRDVRERAKATSGHHGAPGAPTGDGGRRLPVGRVKLDAGRPDALRPTAPLNNAITPFTLAVPQTDLEDLNRRIDQTRWPDAETVSASILRRQGIGLLRAARRLLNPKHRRRHEEPRNRGEQEGHAPSVGFGQAADHDECQDGILLKSKYRIMKELGGRVAVITGGGGGFGREIAMLCAREGMRIVLADIDSAALTATTELLGIDVESLSRRCDVSSAESVEDLAKATYQRFGACHLLFNKAGVGAAGPVWTATLDDWTWTLGVNLMGVVHGIRSFTPRMIEKGRAGPHRQHRLGRGARVSPGIVPLLREQARRGRDHRMSLSPLAAQYTARLRQAIKSGRLSAADIAALVMAAIKEDRFYILPH